MVGSLKDKVTGAIKWDKAGATAAMHAIVKGKLFAEDSRALTSADDLEYLQKARALRCQHDSHRISQAVGRTASAALRPAPQRRGLFSSCSAPSALSLQFDGWPFRHAYQSGTAGHALRTGRTQQCVVIEQPVSMRGVAGILRRPATCLDLLHIHYIAEHCSDAALPVTISDCIRRVILCCRLRDGVMPLQVASRLLQTVPTAPASIEYSRPVAFTVEAAVREDFTDEGYESSGSGNGQLPSPGPQVLALTGPASWGQEDTVMGEAAQPASKTSSRPNKKAKLRPAPEAPSPGRVTWGIGAWSRSQR